MSYNFFVIGGDKRIVYLAEMLSEEKNIVKMLGFEQIFQQNKIFENKYLKQAYSLNEIKDEDIIISSIPLSIDGINIYTPFSSEKIKLETLKGKKIIAGKIPEELFSDGCIDVLKDEKLTMLNTIPTAEGAIAKAIEETDITIENSNCMVLGFGRVGKILSYKLKQLGAKVYAESRNEKMLAEIMAYGYKPINFNEIEKNICKMDIIFNTIPAKILDKDKLIFMNNQSIIIDLASKPGGVDFDVANKMKIKAILYSGIPGKIAPKTSAQNIKKVIQKNLN